jgi:3-methyladenine DNA glycosylase/8-oxoguanine DNA glycosylase
MLEDLVRARGPFSLRVSARLAGDATRRFDGRILVSLFEVDGRLERAACWQETDGAIALRALSEEGLQRLRAVLPLEADHSEFLRRFADDELLGPATRHLRGLRPLRTATVAHALLRAVAAQLITMQEARDIERRVSRVAGVPPTRQALARLAPAELQRLGLSARKAASLVRICRTLDLERLRGLDGDAVAARLRRERGIGPYSIGVVFIEGLGRYDRGINRDLGLVKLLSLIEGRWVEADETDALLARYDEWQGLASVYLLAGWGRGLIPVKVTPSEMRLSRIRTRYAA